MGLLYHLAQMPLPDFYGLYDDDFFSVSTLHATLVNIYFIDFRHAT